MIYREEAPITPDEFRNELTELGRTASFATVYFASANDPELPHVTPYARLALPFEGCHEMVIDDGDEVRTIQPRRGDATFMPAGCWNRNTCIPPRRVVTFMFLPTRLQLNFVTHGGKDDPEQRLRTYAVGRPIGSVGHAIVRALTDLGRRRENRQPTAAHLVRALLEQVLVEVDQPSPVRESRARLTWERVMAHLQENYSEPFSRDDVAEIFDLSPNHLSTLCRQVTGRTLVDVLASIRLAHAQRLLATTSRTVEEIGQSCGYPDASYFCQVFRREVGQSPATWRNTAR